MIARSIAMMQQGPTLFLPPSCLLKENHATIPEKPYTPGISYGSLGSITRRASAIKKCVYLLPISTKRPAEPPRN
jgi:hypothetical protein